jgi:hypothetical protein
MTLDGYELQNIGKELGVDERRDDRQEMAGDKNLNGS